MLPFGVTIPATVPQRSEIPEGLMNYPVCNKMNISLTESELIFSKQNVKNKTEYLVYIVQDVFCLVGTKK
jgi:hypothetical protein